MPFTLYFGHSQPDHAHRGLPMRAPRHRIMAGAIARAALFGATGLTALAADPLLHAVLEAAPVSYDRIRALPNLRTSCAAGSRNRTTRRQAI